MSLTWAGPRFVNFTCGSDGFAVTVVGVVLVDVCVTSTLGASVLAAFIHRWKTTKTQLSKAQGGRWLFSHDSSVVTPQPMTVL